MKKKETVSLTIMMVVALVGFSVIKLAIAGSLSPTAGPESSGSAMYTLSDIYNRLTGNTTATKRSGAFTDAPASVSATGYSLDEIYDAALPTKVPKTGQTSSTTTGDDGDLQKGIAWPSPRLTVNGDGTITDNMTGLVWLQDMNCSGSRVTWATAIEYANNLYDGCADCFDTAGDCGLSDGSQVGDWRLPNIKELMSLVDFTQVNPSLPASNLFTNTYTTCYDTYTIGCNSSYWGYASSSSQGINTAKHWGVNMYYGQPHINDNGQEVFIAWAVRDQF